jgi:hypothetical protein
MAMLNRPMVPSFLQKLDNWLLRHHPSIWQTRVHLALWYILLTGIVLSLLCLVSFNDARRDTEIGGWITFTVLVSILGLVFWLIYLLRFNVFKRFGQWKPFDALVSFLLYFVVSAGLVGLNFIPPIVQTFRANQQYSETEIIKDINDINVTACLLEYDILPLGWIPDTCMVSNKIDQSADAEATRPLQTVNNYYRVVDTIELSRRLNSSDSVVKLNPELYVFFSPMDYQFVHFYRSRWDNSDEILSSAEIYRKYLKAPPAINRTELVRRMTELKDKWALYDRYNYYYGNEFDNSAQSYTTRIEKKYDLRRLRDGIDSALDKKFRFDREQGIFWRFFFYPAFFMALLIFIFRNSTVRTFFLTLLTVVLLMIFTGLLIVSLSGSEETSFLGILIFYYLVFGGIALSISSSGKRSAIQGIGLNLFFFMTPFVPLMLTAYYIQSTRWDSDYPYNFHHEWPGGLSETELLMIAEVAGVVLVLLLIQLLFRKLYRKWYALPEN